ncbi:peroxide stress protein YaaA, partial [Aquimarina celericrescens]|nr:peroxide stress protein YaaA [Aquimarina celericrescens]
FETTVPTQKYTTSDFLADAEKLNEVLKGKSPQNISGLMCISDKLAQLNWQRNQDWNLPFTIDNARQAVYAFNGDVYTGLDVYTLAEDKLD